MTKEYDAKEDVKSMLDSLGGFKEAEPKTDPPATDPPQDDIETDPPVVTDEPETDPPATDAPDDDKFSDLMKKNRELEEKIKALDKKESEKVPKTEAPTTDPPISDFDFSSDVDLDDVSRDPAELNKLLNTVYKKAVETVRGEYKALGRKTFEAIPAEVDRTITTKNQLQELTTKFYKDNADLKPWAKTVGVVFDEVMAESPDASYGEALNKVATLTRERIGLKPGKAKPDNDDKPPPLHRKKGERVRPKPKETGKLGNEIEEMNKSLNR